MLLLDQGLPRGLVTLLSNAGVEAEHVGELGMASSKDREILKYSKNKKRTIVTLDSDFHSLLALNADSLPSVIRIRIEGLKAENYLPLIQMVIAQCDDDLKSGCVISVQETQIRLRHLPIGKDL